MTVELLPDIPRIYTALAEWLACTVFITAVGFRRPRRLSTVYMALALPVFVIVQETAGQAPLSLWALGMMVAVLVTILVIKLSANVTWSGAVYVGARAFILAELGASLGWQLQFYFLRDSQGTRSGLELPWLIGTYVVVNTAVFLLARTHFTSIGPLRVPPQTLWASVGIATSTFVVSNLSFAPISTPFSGTLALEVSVIRTLVDVAGLVALMAQEVARLRTTKALELERTHDMLKTQHTQYLRSRANIELVNSKYHDLKHFIAAIRAEPSSAKRNQYLDRLEQSIVGYENEIGSGDIVIDAIVSTKKLDAARHDITMTAVVDPKAVEFIDPLDLSVILGNALDNAIEHVRQLPEQRRLIKLAVFSQGQFSVLRIENCLGDKVKIVDGLPQTTKRDTLNHGYGLRNIRDVAEHYDGTLTITPQDGWFVLRILVPVPTTPQTAPS